MRENSITLRDRSNDAGMSHLSPRADRTAVALSSQSARALSPKPRRCQKLASASSIVRRAISTVCRRTTSRAAFEMMACCMGLLAVAQPIHTVPTGLPGSGARRSGDARDRHRDIAAQLAQGATGHLQGHQLVDGPPVARARPRKRREVRPSPRSRSSRCRRAPRPTTQARK